MDVQLTTVQQELLGFVDTSIIQDNADWIVILVCLSNLLHEVHQVICSSLLHRLDAIVSVKRHEAEHRLDTSAAALLIHPTARRQHSVLIGAILNTGAIQKT
jgi:hypothetical protein